MSDKAAKTAKEKIAGCIKAIKHPKNDKEQFKAIQQYNSTVAGLHNYYRFATNVSLDFAKIAFASKKRLKSRLKELTPNGKLEHGLVKEKYGKSKQLRFLNGHPLIPVGYVQTKDAQHKRRIVNRYTPEGREAIHKNLQIDTSVLLWLMRNPSPDKSIEFADNRISLFAAQYGRCAVTGIFLMPHDVYCHHKIPKENGGTDEYANLILVTEAVHILIHATLTETIQKHFTKLQLNAKQLAKLNKLRITVGNSAI